MSRNEWERGTLRFSNTKSYQTFKKRVVERFRQQIQKDLQAANQALAAVKAQKPKGSRNFPWEARLSAAFNEGAFKLQALSSWDVARFMTHDREEKTEPCKHVGWTPRSAPRQLTAKEAGKVSMKTSGLLRFDDNGRTVTWSVSESNHACEFARETFLGRVTFEELGKVDWGRSGGGVIVGNDEYNQDSKNAGGGANYIKDVFGPAGKKEQELTTGVRFSRLRGVPSLSSLRR